MRTSLFVATLSCLVNLGCESTECTSQRDCPTGNICTGEGECVPSACANPPCQVPQDAGPRDTGIDTGVGAGDAGDAGVDAGDGGPDSGVDGGPDGGVDGGDGGVDGGSDGGVASGGKVWIAEFLTTPASFTAFAEFLDRSAGDYDVSVETFSPANATCTLRRQRRVGGMEVGIEAGSVMIETGQLPNQQITYVSVGAGRYEPPAPLTANIYFNSPGVDFDIVGGNGSGVPPTAVSLPSPPPLNVVLPVGNQPVSLQQGVTFSWQVAGASTDGRVTVAELYDTNRDVSLSCVVQDTGGFTLPSDLIQAFFDESPVSPYTLELRYQYSAVETVTLQGTSDELPIELIAARGQRWAAQ